MYIKEHTNIEVKNIRIGLSQARLRDVSKNIDELANSIQQLGLLEPIVVAPGKDEEGTFEVITGQRRFLAVQELGWTHITAGILDSPVNDPLMAKAISLTENMVREEMTTRDYIDACTELYRRYGTIKAVCDELGLPQRRVSSYVKFDQLTRELKEMVDEGLDLQVALRAQKATTNSDGSNNPGKAETLAKEMKNLGGSQQRKMVQVAERNPGIPIEQIIEEGRTRAQIKTVSVSLGVSFSEGLDVFATEEGTNRAEAAAGLIEEGLTTKGYVDQE